MESLSEKRARAGRIGGKIGGKAKVAKGFSFHRDLARENARKTNEKLARRVEVEFRGTADDGTSIPVRVG
jgi:hypothetical protein